MTNATTARDWFVEQCGEAAIADHFVALSTALDKTQAFGIRDDRAFGLLGLGWRALFSLVGNWPFGHACRRV